MSAFELILRFPRGSVLIGGHASISDGVHAVHARLHNGQPFLPASAIRGALRESLEGLLRADEPSQPACAGGDGRLPGDNREPTFCALDQGRPCRACRLLGGGRDKLPQGERTFSALVLGEAQLAEHEHVDWQSRFGVAIDRSRQSAADGMLVRRMVPEPGLVFRATGRLTSDKDTLRNDLEAAVRATTHIGSGRSSGFARVEMELRWLETTTTSPKMSGENIEIAFELVTPASLGVPIAIGNFRDTRRCIPGSALRGAIGFALAEMLPDTDDPDFKALVNEDNGAIFDFAYAVDDERAAGLVGPWPLTMQRCKHHASHGMVDTLLDRIAVANIESVNEIPAFNDLYSCPSPECKGQLGGVKGSRAAKEPPKVQVVTRVAMDRKRSSAKDGALFSYAQIVRGTRFVGSIRAIPEQARAYLARALASPLSVGRARSLGWGSIRILRVTPPAPSVSLENRALAFDAALAARKGPAGQLIPITLLSPLVIDSEDDDGRMTLQNALGIPLRSWPVVARRFDLERGWDQMNGRRPVVRVARAGSVFVAELPKGTRWNEFLPMLSKLEAEGAGDRKRMGFGRVICFDPLICQGVKNP